MTKETKHFRAYFSPLKIDVALQICVVETLFLLVKGRLPFTMHKNNFTNNAFETMQLHAMQCMLCNAMQSYAI